MKENEELSLIEDAAEYVQELFRTNAGGHDADHTMRVYRNTLRIAENEPDCDVRIAALAALLHDADDHKLFNTKNNANARAFLEAHQVTLQTIDRICGVINSVSFKQNKGKAPDTPEGKVVQDADRLDAMGAIGVARAFAYGGEHGRSMADSVHEYRYRKADGRAAACFPGSFFEGILRRGRGKRVKKHSDELIFHSQGGNIDHTYNR